MPASDRFETATLQSRPTTCDFLSPPQEKDELGRLDNYRIVKVLGQGGMGMVFEAEDLQLKRPVALKVMLPKLAADPAAKARFVREAQAAAAVRHDHVVTIYQAGEAGPVAFLAMELLAGQTLEDRLQGGTALPMDEVLRIGWEIADGLAAAHERGLIHRDIKPANVWLEDRQADTKTRTPADNENQETCDRFPASSSSAAPRVKILDFGLARPADEDGRLTSANAVVGTPAYMSPEQASGATVDARSDLFSLGCVLYRMCTGQRAFSGRSALQIMHSLVHDQPPLPRQANPAVPVMLSDLVMRLLAKDPALRPASAREAAELLRRALTVPAQPSPSGSRRPDKRPGLWAAVAAGLLILVGGGYALYQAVTIRDNNGNAVEANKVTDAARVEIAPDSQAGNDQKHKDDTSDKKQSAPGSDPVKESAGPGKEVKAFDQPPPGWQIYEPQECGFLVWLPGTPTSRAKPAKAGAPQEVKYQDALTGLTFIVGHTLYGLADADADKAMDAMRDTYKKKNNATVLGEKPLQLGAFPGREVRFALSDARIHLRMYVVGRQFHMLAVAGSPKTMEGQSAEIFFSSFRLVGQRGGEVKQKTSRTRPPTSDRPFLGWPIQG